ncbi:MAG: FIG017823: ATPase, MoxR family, partial [uncultured Thermoleophilia bacterium]
RDRHRDRARRRGRGTHQGDDRRTGRAFSHRGGRHAGVDDAVHPLRPPRRGRPRDHRQAALGSGSPRQPVADAGGARPRASRGAARAVDRGCGDPRRARAQAPHGDDLRGPRRRRDDPESRRPPRGAAAL